MARPRKEIEDSLLDGSWQIDCTSMRLEQGDSKAAVAFEGRGYLRQDETGSVTFKLYVTEEKNYQPLRAFEDLGTPGKLIPPGEYFKLSATDQYGRVWVSERVRPDMLLSYQDGKAVATASGMAYGIEAISDSVYDDGANHIRIVFFAKVELPANSATKIVTELTVN
jgi:hypothetical protein